MAKINERIKERRLAKDMTLLQVADELGVKEATMQRYESGEIKNIKHETIEKLAEIFDCSPEYLMGWTDLVQRPIIYDASPNTNLFVREESPIYNYNENIAAHRDSEEDWTPEELKKIEEYKQLLKAARKNVR